MTSIYSAILKAADHIERKPQLFDFERIPIPSRCGTPGCALGWIGWFYGRQRCMEADEGYDGVGAVAVIMGLKAGFDFYARMEALTGGFEWMRDAKECARVMRLYAEKYHGHEKPHPTSELVADLMAEIWEQAKKSQESELARAEWERT